MRPTDGNLVRRRFLMPLRQTGWQILQCSVGAGVAWWLASTVLGHDTPYFAPVAAVLCLGMTYGRRFRRIGEIAVGVAVGIAVADLLLGLFGMGAWQLAVIVGLTMLLAVIVDGGPLLVMQAASQAIVVAVLLENTGTGVSRWIDALVGGVAAMVVALFAPVDALRRPRRAAATVLGELSAILESSAAVLAEPAMTSARELVARSRLLDAQRSAMLESVDEAMATSEQSPLWRRERRDARSVSAVVRTVDELAGTVHTFVERIHVVTYRQRRIPGAWVELCRDLADLCGQASQAVSHRRELVDIREAAVDLGRRTASSSLGSAPVEAALLTDLRTVIVALLRLTGVPDLEATAMLPAIDGWDDRGVH